MPPMPKSETALSGGASHMVANAARAKDRIQNIIGRMRGSLTKDETGAEFDRQAGPVYTQREPARSSEGPRVTTASSAKPAPAGQTFEDDQLDIPAFLRRLPANK